MRTTLKLADYQAAFTVIEKKVKCDVKAYQVNRYMVFGVDTSIFRRAVNFDGQEGVDSTITAINNAEAPARLFFPTAFTGVTAPLKQTEKTAAEKAAAKAAAEAAKAAEKAAETAEPAAPAAAADAPTAETTATEQAALTPTVSAESAAPTTPAAPVPSSGKPKKAKSKKGKK